MQFENDPELSGKYLGRISQDFAKISDTLKEAAYQVIKRGFSQYPVFPISHEEVPIGQMLFKKEDLNLDWNYNITYIDEFLDRHIIDQEKLDEFKKIYKDPDEFCCLFVIDGAFTRFVFIPYPEE